VSLPAPLRVLFLADAGPQVGGGHVMRCLTLARALTARGADCAFVESRSAAPILRRFGWPAQTLLAILDEEDLPGLVACAADFAERLEADVVVLDHYGIGAAEEERLKAAGRRIVVIDDLVDRRHICDLLVDPSFGRRREHYDALAPPGAAVCVGPVYALVRPDFAAARQRAMSRRARHAPVGRALVSLGLTDVGGVTARTAEALLKVMGEIRLDVVIGGGAPSLKALSAAAQRDRRLRLWVDSAEMASLMADADIAVGAGGSSVWERATVGLPAATLILAENQRGMVEQMAAAGLTLAIDQTRADFEARLREVWGVLVADRELRWRLAERSADLCDGHGAERVADAVMQLRV
jgi:UDP-2,4-diacetamido-2,4,6-trideoxy-beta-L-altropyranose hydrolase